jgi:hypothetical protein
MSQYTKKMIFCDKSLATRFEKAEAELLRLYATTLSNLPVKFRVKKVAIEPICGGAMLYSAPGSPLNHALGMGLTHTVKAKDLERVEKFYSSRKSPVEIQVAPFTDLSFQNMLVERGYKITEFANVLVRSLKEPLVKPKVRGLSIKKTHPSQAEFATNVTCDGFEAVNFSPVVRQTLLAFQFLPNSLCYMAWDKHTPVSSAAGVVFPKLKLAMLYGTATLPKYRGRGAQGALIRARLVAAKRMGCEWATITTFPGTTSQHNAERAGFQVAYTKVTWVKEKL